MTRTVWKFPVDWADRFADRFELEMPTGAKVAHVAQQADEMVTLWAEVDPDARRETRRFAIVGTGHPVPDGHSHVGTWLSGPFVWHLYEATS